METQQKSTYAFEMLNIHKYFANGQIKANYGINLSVKHNEIHAIIGENGAGKSTLMSILFGLYQPDVGQIKINGQEISFKSAKDASKHKIGMVHQHFLLVNDYSVIDNVILGSEFTKLSVFLDRAKAITKIKALIKKYNFNISINKKVGNLSVAQQQKVEILKVLYRDCDIIIFDEPTAVLSDQEIESFLKMVKDFKEQGKTIVLISHKLYEIKAIADRATIIRKGKYIDTVNVKDVSVEELAEMMVGRKIVPSVNLNPGKNIDESKVILEVKNLDLSESISKTEKVLSYLTGKVDTDSMQVANQNATVSFKIHAGEIFAIAGVEGNGQERLAQFITGFKKVRKGSIKYYFHKQIDFTLNDADIVEREKISGSLKNTLAKVNTLAKHHISIAHVPEDRHKYGLTLDLNCRYNLVNNSISYYPFSKSGILRKNNIANYANDLIQKFDIRGTFNGTALARSLSGGNQQKLIVAREISRKLDLIVLSEPTRGLDVGAIEYIHQQIIEAKNNHQAVLLISYELDEILALADTIAVMSRNKIVGMGPRTTMTREKIGMLIAGEEK